MIVGCDPSTLAKLSVCGNELRDADPADLFDQPPLEEADDEISKGDYINHDDVKKQMLKW